VIGFDRAAPDAQEIKLPAPGECLQLPASVGGSIDFMERIGE
jgi:hypothetical protein